MHNYYFNAESHAHEYTHHTQATVGTLSPANALRVAPEFATGFWPCEQNGAWIQIADHRQKIDAQGRIIAGSGTPYWLANDTWQTPVRYMASLGDLPAGALFIQPAKTQIEINQERITTIKQQLAEIDTKSIRPQRAVTAGTATSDDLTALKELEARATALRIELARLLNEI